MLGQRAPVHIGDVVRKVASDTIRTWYVNTRADHIVHSVDRRGKCNWCQEAVGRNVHITLVSDTTRTCIPVPKDVYSQLVHPN